MRAGIPSLLQGLLRLDPETAAEIYQLAGSVIQINLVNTAACFTFLIQDDGIALLDDEPERINVRISGTPAALLAYLAVQRYGQGGRGGGLANDLASDLEISGDINLAQRLTASVKRLEVDWEEQLAAVIGDTLAHQSARLARSGLSMAKRLHTKLEDDLGEFLVFEQALVADEDELNAFNRAVDELRNDLERLQQRAARLTKEAPD